MKNWKRFWKYSKRTDGQTDRRTTNDRRQTAFYGFSISKGNLHPVNPVRKRNLPLLLLGFLLFLSPARIANACGPYEYMFHGYSFINPAIVKKDNPYSAYFFQFDELYESYTSSREKQETNNLVEWRGRFCNLVELEDLRKVIYEASLEDLDLLRTSIRSPKLPLDYRMVGNSFAQHLKENQCTETIDYLIFAKECEPHVTAPADAWQAPQRDVEAMMKLAKKGRRQFMKTDSYYIRLRYAYQIVRLAHYAERFEDALALYDFLMPKVDSKVKSIIRDWVLGHKAGALMRLGRNVEASYLYAKIFQNCPGKRESAYRSFKIKSDEEWKQLNLLCATDEERAILYAIRANNQESKAVEEMQKIYELSPNDSNLELLLVREIKKLERDLLGLEFNDKKRQNKSWFNLPRKDAGRYLLDLHTFVKLLLEENKVVDKQLWKIANGYLYFLGGDYYSARSEFNLAKAEIKNDTLQEQLGAFQLAMQIAAYDKVTREEEEEIGDFIRDNELYRKYPDFQDYLFDKLTYSYKVHDEKGKAFLAQNKVRDIAFNPDWEIINDLIKLDTVPEKSVIERAFFRDEDGKEILNYLMELKGTLLFAQQQWEAASEFFKLISVEELDKTKFNPFEERINDCVHCPPLDSLAYNKLDIVNALLAYDYQGKAEMDKGAEYFYQIGLALYNMSYFGNSWQAMDNFRSGGNWYYLNDDNVYPLYGSPSGNKEMNDMTQALYFFEKARLLTKDPNLAAKAAFKAAKCQQKNYFLSKESNYNQYSGQIPDMPEEYLNYFKMLKEDYADTEVVEQLIEECKYFEVYMAK